MSEPNGPTDRADDGAGRPVRRRGRTIAIVVLSVVVAALLIVVVVLATRGSTPATGPTGSTAPAAAPSTPPASQATTTTTAPAPPSTSSAETARCDTSRLSVTHGQVDGAAGSVHIPIVFTNVSAAPCELHGFPGVSLVGEGDGQQLGAPADWDESQPIVQNALQPNGSVQTALRVVQAGNFDPAQCQPQPADGLRVYPPHSAESVFVQVNGLTACASESVHLLSIEKPVAPAA